jgi:hypothetical protein
MDRSSFLCRCLICIEYVNLVSGWGLKLSTSLRRTNGLVGISYSIFMKLTTVKAEITIVYSSYSDCHITVLILFRKTCVDLSQHASIKANLSSNSHDPDHLGRHFHHQRWPLPPAPTKPPQKKCPADPLPNAKWYQHTIICTDDSHCEGQKKCCWNITRNTM